MSSLRNDPKQVMLLDGYNVIHRLPDLANNSARSLQQMREELARYMVTWKQKRKYKGTIYVVFDGQDSQPHSLEQSVLSGIKCIYSCQKEEADGKIISIIRNTAHPEQVVIVSDDNYIANHARSFGAYIKPVSYLSASLKKKKVSRKTSGGEKRIDAATAHSITNQMKKIWGISDKE